MFTQEVLENNRRRKIYGFIEKNPGVYLRRLQRDLRMPLTSLEYHLNYMVRKGVIFGEKDGRYRRYYVKQLDSEEKKILSVLRQKRMREIVLFVFLAKKAKYNHLLKELRVPPSTLSFYLKYLVDHNILARHKIGRENIYTIKSEDQVAKMLISYKSSFVDRLVDNVLSTWMETEFRKKKDNNLET
ncbi:MAG: transcriptional regulator [Candidatus Bathyarchaeota archaeon]|nr:MAG: transcriptional regulator [Candidatus Bathyarchaeota archaeon]